MTKNSAIDTLRARRSIRKYCSGEIPPEDLQKIVEIGQRAPSACNSQLYSIIEVKDLDLRKNIRKICRDSAFITEASVLFVICADLRRLGKVVEFSGGTRTTWPVKGLFWGIIDAAIMAQNMVNSAELLGYSSVYVGWVSEHMDEVIDVLKIPKFVVPVVGLVIGRPRETPPENRPRLPLELIWHIDLYQDPPITALKKGIAYMNQELERQEFFKSVGEPDIENWSQDLIQQFGLKDQLKLEQNMRKTLAQQGLFQGEP